MMRSLLAVVIMAALAAPAFADAAAYPCANALEQLSALETQLPVYKLVRPDSRQYLDDQDRPSELARVRAVIASACSTDPAARAAEQAEAQRLHQGRSPECSFEREKLAAMEKPDSRNDRDDIAKQRKRVESRCPDVPMADVWLVAERPSLQ